MLKDFVGNQRGCINGYYNFWMQNTILNVVRDRDGVITAQARTNDVDDIGFSFVYCEVKGIKSSKGTFLGRAWRSHPKVVFAYTTMSFIVNPLGWEVSPNGTPT